MSNDPETGENSLRDSAFTASFRHFLAPIQSLLEDDSVNEIMINRYDRIFYEKKGHISPAEGFTFGSPERLHAAASSIAQYIGRHVDNSAPLLDGRLPNGSRVCIVLHPVATEGTSINIRTFRKSNSKPEYLLSEGSINKEGLEFLKLAVLARRNILVSGGTSSGKTTLLNVLASYFDEDERVVAIEDTRELQIERENVVYLESRPPDEFGEGEISIRRLFVTSLRMRPDRLVVGEVRQGEALDMIQAMISGHRGSLSTLHANTVFDACQRLETMALMADMGIPLAALRTQVVSALDIVVQTVKLPGRRIISHISEVTLGNDSEGRPVYVVKDIYRRGHRWGDVMEWTKERPEMTKEIEMLGLAKRASLTRRVFGLEEE